TPSTTPLAALRLALGLVFAQEPLEEPEMPLFVAQDADDHVLRHPVDAVGGLDDLVVEADGLALAIDHAADDVDDVRLLARRLQAVLLGPELERARHDAVELLDP